MSMKPVEIKAWMGDGTEYVVRYYKEADFDAKERECERLIAAQSREGRHALRVEVERLRELLREARDFLSEHELNVFGAGATLFTKLCAAIKEGKP